MDSNAYWSVVSCRWESCRPETRACWSVQRCRWERSSPVADALATPWSIVAAAQGAVHVAEQRRAQGAPVDA